MLASRARHRKDTYEANLARWLTAIGPEALRSSSWLFAAMPIEYCALLAPLWAISVASEGRVLADEMEGEDRCVIILDGVRAGEWRILVGDDAHRLDEAVRASPAAAYDDIAIGEVLFAELNEAVAQTEA